MARPSFNNPIPRTGMPHFAESSPLRSPRDSDSVPRSHIKHRSAAFNLESMIQAVQQIQRQLARMRIRKGGQSGSGDSWPPTNYSATITGIQAFDEGDWVFVRATDEAVTTGVTDPDSEEVVYSTPGMYRALRDVTPIAIGGGLFDYHIPLATLPDQTDINGDLNYWWFAGPILSC